MGKVFITREIPKQAAELLRNAGHTVEISKKEGVLTKAELIKELSLQSYDAVLCLLTDKIDASVFDVTPKAKIFANYAVGFNNIDIEEAKKRNIIVTNTPDVLTDTVAEHTIAMMLSVTSRITEGDRFVRAGKFVGWEPLLLLGTDLKGKTLGVLGAGRIGTKVAEIAYHGFGMNIIYYDVKESEYIEENTNARFYSDPGKVLEQADVVTLHVPLLDSTRHFLNEGRLKRMKKGSYLINSSRGPVIDEKALVEVLESGHIRGAALDVFEEEPKLAKGLAQLESVVITPHIASATEETRGRWHAWRHRI